MMSNQAAIQISDQIDGIVCYVVLSIGCCYSLFAYCRELFVLRQSHRKLRTNILLLTFVNGLLLLIYSSLARHYIPAAIGGVAAGIGSENNNHHYHRNNSSSSGGGGGNNDDDGEGGGSFPPVVPEQPNRQIIFNPPSSVWISDSDAAVKDDDAAADMLPDECLLPPIGGRPITLPSRSDDNETINYDDQYHPTVATTNDDYIINDDKHSDDSPYLSLLPVNGMVEETNKSINSNNNYSSNYDDNDDDDDGDDDDMQQQQRPRRNHSRDRQQAGEEECRRRRKAYVIGSFYEGTGDMVVTLIAMIQYFMVISWFRRASQDVDDDDIVVQLDWMSALFTLCCLAYFGVGIWLLHLSYARFNYYQDISLTVLSFLLLVACLFYVFKTVSGTNVLDISYGTLTVIRRSRVTVYLLAFCGVLAVTFSALSAFSSISAYVNVLETKYYACHRLPCLISFFLRMIFCIFIPNCCLSYMFSSPPERQIHLLPVTSGNSSSMNRRGTVSRVTGSNRYLSKNFDYHSVPS